MKKLLIVLSLLAFVILLASCGAEDISEYQIVIPENATLTEAYAAENLSEIIKIYYDVSVNIVKDTEKEKKHEILIGETNRNESKTDTSLGEMQYLLFKSGNKIVIKGNGIYIGSACGKLANEHLTIQDGDIFVTDLSKNASAYTYALPTQCDNVIFMIGDGMGENHILLGEQKCNFSFVARQFPNKGMSVTRSQSVINGDASYTDSAASGTAMATGYKTINGYLGLDKDGNRLLNVRELAHSVGAKTAVITTDKITGATPSAYLCHNISRENTNELLTEINALIADNKVNYCMGDVGYDLTLETKIALNEISKDNSKFFIMIEEGWIDKHSHNKNLLSTAYMVQRFNDAIEYATQFALMHPNTALIVTADHETGKLDEKNGMFLFRSDNHTNKDVPIFAIGAGTDIFYGATVENVELAKFVAKAYSNNDFGMSLDALPTMSVVSGWWLVASKEMSMR